MSPKTIAFFGASTGCGLAALKLSLAAGHTCIALCRIPAKLEAILPPSAHPNLTIIAGNAHSAAAVSSALTIPSTPTRFVDAVLFSIGGAFSFSTMSLDDPHVCGTGMRVLLSALASLRAAGVVGAPHVTALSTTGISAAGRDVPLVYVPLYHGVLRVPHADKKVMEAALVGAGEQWTVVRPTLLVDGASEKKVRVGVEDAVNGWEKKALGYSISREDVGRWIFDNVLEKGGYESKYVTLSW
ncbi:hypothetical protein TD95_003877 [Thielaviopsis punctulata]|uniref:NAD(P)-binding domain-containing protein n=1 Tax=Thielaviopsis punctulata TaxID=72032 RepID=A0A0F4ZJK9_9PEZI|nr:hypothetical protein TD95_003877 [Thielaviopsis punctulata]